MTVAREVLVIRDPYSTTVAVLPAAGMAAQAGRSQAKLVLALLGVSVALCLYDLYTLVTFAMTA
jgi:hypothetical protein